MSILERSASRPDSALAHAPASERLRVVTGGRVGNMEARLGTSGFDVIAVADTEDALIDAVAADDPDAIVVEADLCDSLERVRDLAPDAVLIVVGDHTPAGAQGRIERGVSGTVMAGLLHALVADGVGAAVPFGLIPALGRSAAPVAHHVGGSLLAAKAELVRSAVANAWHEHGGLIAAAGTVAVTVSASLILTLSAPRTHERAETLSVPAPAVEGAPTGSLVPTSPSTSTSPARRIDMHRPPVASDTGAADRGGSSGSTDHGGHHDPPSDHGSPPAGSDATRPPGVATGWDVRPPKQDDHGNHTGWSNNSVPADHPPGAKHSG